MRDELLLRFILCRFPVAVLISRHISISTKYRLETFLYLDNREVSYLVVQIILLPFATLHKILCL